MRSLLLWELRRPLVPAAANQRVMSDIVLRGHLVWFRFRFCSGSVICVGDIFRRGLHISSILCSLLRSCSIGSALNIGGCSTTVAPRALPPALPLETFPRSG